jgi:hypothetical protein
MRKKEMFHSLQRKGRQMVAKRVGNKRMRSGYAAAVEHAKTNPSLTNHEIAGKVDITEQSVCAAIKRELYRNDDAAWCHSPKLA